MHYSSTEYISTSSPIKVLISEDLFDRKWDLFVQKNPSGFHEQSSGWAAAKYLEGWNPVRIILMKDQEIRGGFQILLKKKKFAGIVGFLNKGPLLDSDDPILRERIISELKNVVKQFRIILLIIAPPAGGHSEIIKFDERDFPKNNIFTIIDTTLEIDLAKTSDLLLKDLRKTLRNSIRHLDGFKLRRGTSTELGIFFDLMCETCRRQDVTPNPSSLEIFETLWENFSGNDMIRLYLLEKEGEIIAGAIMLVIRERFIIWKIGWNGQYPKSNPNAALFWYSIMLAKEEGFKIFDFASVDSKTAEHIKNQKKLPAEIIRTPTFFKLGFGGEIVKLPASLVYFPNTLFKAAYKFYCYLLPLIPILPRPGRND